MKILDDLERLLEAATERPWAWESCGEKSNGYVIGTACDGAGKMHAGRIPDGYDEGRDVFMADEFVRKHVVGEHDAATCNYSDPALIVAVVNHAEALIAVARAGAEFGRRYGQSHGIDVFVDDAYEVHADALRALGEVGP